MSLMEDIVLKYNPDLKLVTGTLYIDREGNYIDVLPEDQAQQKIDEINAEAVQYSLSGRRAEDQPEIVSKMFLLVGYFYARRRMYNRAGRFALTEHPGGKAKVTFEEFSTAYPENAIRSLKNFDPEKGQYVAHFISTLGYMINDAYTKKIQTDSNEQLVDNFEPVLYSSDGAGEGHARKVTDSTQQQKEWSEKGFVTLASLRTGDEEKKKKAAGRSVKPDPSRKVYADDPMQEVLQQEQTGIIANGLYLLFAQMSLLRKSLSEGNLGKRETKKAARLNAFYTGQIINELKQNRDLSGFRNHSRDAWESLDHAFNEYVYVKNPEALAGMIRNALKTNREVFGDKAKSNADKELSIPLINKVYAAYLHIQETQVKDYLEEYTKHVMGIVYQSIPS